MSNETKHDGNDDLLSRLDDLSRQTQRGLERATALQSDPYATAAKGLRQAMKGISWAQKFGARAGAMGRFLWESVGRPVWTVLDPVVGWLARFYARKVWPHAYRTEEDGSKSFSPKRAGIVLTATFAAAAAVLPAAQLAFEAGQMAVTMRDKVVYLHTVNDHDDGTYSIKGCDKLAVCDTDDADYYNVESSLAKHIWSLFNKGSLYIPRRIVGTVAPDGNNKCDIKIYAAYYEKAMQNLDIYPQLLDIKCVRVDNDGNPIGQVQAPMPAGL